MIGIIAEEFNLDKTFYTAKLEKIVKALGIKGDIVIKLGDKEAAKALNATYLKRDWPTDVLSFPFNEDLPDGYYLGDVFICYPMAEEQAKESAVSLEEGLFNLMVHGILHLAGYNHETDQGEMAALQQELVGQHFKPLKR